MSEKILVVSDSHGMNEKLRRVLKYFGGRGQDLTMMIHLGDMGGTRSEIERMVDCPLVMVKGNGDFDADLSYSKLIKIWDETALITHGHRYNCKYSTQAMADMARENGASMVFFGHTHEPLVDTSGEIKLFNPGSITLPRQAGFKPTYLVVTREDDGSKNFVVVEMGR